MIKLHPGLHYWVSPVCAGAQSVYNNLLDKSATESNILCNISTLEIKPCGLGSRIRDTETESYNWFHLLVNI